MSLLSSIFGNDDDKSQKKNRSSSLFDKKASESLPDRPYHEPAPARPAAAATEKIDVNTADKNKSKKKRKQKAKSGVTAPSENNEKEEIPSKKKKKRKTTKDSAENDEEPTKMERKKEKAEDDEKSRSSSSSSDDSESSNSDSESGDEKETENKNDDDDIDQTTEEKETIKKEDGDDDAVDEAAKERTIFVGNLPIASTTRKTLAKLFKDCGPISSTRIRSVPVKGVKLPQQRAGDQNLVKKICANTGQYDESLSATVQGYVVFVKQESVEKALAKNNTTVSMAGTGSGKFRIKVDTAQPTMDASRSVFVGNLPYSSDEITLQDHFVTGCGLGKGDVVSVRVIRDKETFQCKGFGYVLLKERDMVSSALKLHGSSYKNKPIRVMVCGKRFKGRKDLKQKTNKKTSTNSTDSPRRQQKPEKLSAGALRRILSKQQSEQSSTNKRKRGAAGGTSSSSSKAHKASGSSSKSSKRAAADKKADQRLKKIQKRISRGMGKTKKGY